MVEISLGMLLGACIMLTGIFMGTGLTIMNQKREQDKINEENARNNLRNKVGDN